MYVHTIRRSGHGRGCTDRLRCDYTIEGAEISVPGTLVNGVFLHTFKTKRHVDARVMPPESIRETERARARHNASGFVYTFGENNLPLFYTNPDDLQHTQYFSKQAQETCAEIVQAESLHTAAEGRDAVYFALTGKKNAVHPIYRDILEISGINAVMYLNVYNGLYCLEVFDAQANKANALAKLKVIVEPDEVVVFGDNHNDIEMMKMADRSYAPENALPEVKALADGVIASCDDDGVARFLAEAHRL